MKRTVTKEVDVIICDSCLQDVTSFVPKCAVCGGDTCRTCQKSFRQPSFSWSEIDWDESEQIACDFCWENGLEAQLDEQSCIVAKTENEVKESWSKMLEHISALRGGQIK